MRVLNFEYWLPSFCYYKVYSTACIFSSVCVVYYYQCCIVKISPFLAIKMHCVFVYILHFVFHKFVGSFKGVMCFPRVSKGDGP
jgi:hypothetical protein